MGPWIKPRDVKNVTAIRHRLLGLGRMALQKLKKEEAGDLTMEALEEMFETAHVRFCIVT